MELEVLLTSARMNSALAGFVEPPVANLSFGQRSISALTHSVDEGERLEHHRRANALGMPGFVSPAALDAMELTLAIGRQALEHVERREREGRAAREMIPTNLSSLLRPYQRPRRPHPTINIHIHS